MESRTRGFMDPGAPDGFTVALYGCHTTKISYRDSNSSGVHRSPTVLAAMADVVGQALPGRFVLGLGSSSQTIMQNLREI
ncbi:MAG: hypothetical protein CM1200mP24_09400 [Gammaproteobacteria bacterium]|nr:MAG: hypothetical protein CM1200mP24_09400 [Gammaproteobacteria bacterium]